jgi:integrase/recombinase XerD
VQGVAPHVLPCAGHKQSTRWGPLMQEPQDVRWERYPNILHPSFAQRWVETGSLLGLAPNTIDAYARSIDQFLGFCASDNIDPVRATRDVVAQYVGALRARPSARGPSIVAIDSGAGLSNATLQQRLTALRLFFDYLVEEGVRSTNPVGRGRLGLRRGLLPRFRRLPWIPTEDQWTQLVLAAREERLRNRCMLALAYDAGLRREELCLLETTDLDPAHRMLRVRAETNKSRRSRVVPYSAATGRVLRAYLSERRSLSQSRGRLFLSESRRNRACPITLWTWSKVVRGLAMRACVPRFSTHTLRHLCLTDLARSGWDLHEIASFAGHRNVQTTQLYIHLSGRDLARKLAAGMAEVHERRGASLVADGAVGGRA